MSTITIIAVIINIILALFKLLQYMVEGKEKYLHTVYLIVILTTLMTEQ